MILYKHKTCGISRELCCGLPLEVELSLIGMQTIILLLIMSSVTVFL